MHPEPYQPPVSRDPPAFNVPGVVLAFIAVMAALHAGRILLSPAAEFQLLATFAFIPARYGATHAHLVFPGGWPADIWSWFSYSFLHADAVHLVVNAVWLLAFASPVARRFGPARFVALSMAASAGGAAAYLFVRWDQLAPMIGASAIVSAYMGAAIRFVFGGLAGIGGFGAGDAPLHRAPARPLAVALRNPSMLAFLAVWFGINILFGFGSEAIPGVSGGIAWEAHIGGFLVGLLGFSLFDPVGRSGSGDGRYSSGSS